MKFIILLCLSIFLVACGKKSSSSSSSTYSLSSLQSNGVTFVSYSSYGTVVVKCVSNGASTNQQRIDGLMSLKNSLGGQQSYDLVGTGTSMSSYKLVNLIDDAIYSLSYGNPYSTSCPTTTLASSY